MANRITEHTVTELTGKDPSEFATILRIKMKRDLTLNSLQELGQIVPKLQVLKLNGSNIHTLRDIGTSLKHLKALSVSRCGLRELSGLICFPKLQELYCSFNSIKDLKSVSDAFLLQVLDLEGNEIDDAG